VRGANAGAVQHCGVGGFDEAHKGAKGIAMDVLARLEQSMEEGGGAAADGPHAVDALTVDILGGTLFVRWIVAAVGYGFTATKASSVENALTSVRRQHCSG